MAKDGKFIKLSNWLKNERIGQTFWDTPLCSHSPPFGHLGMYFNDRWAQNLGIAKWGAVGMDPYQDFCDFFFHQF